MTRLYARALKGKRAKGKRPDKRGKNVTLVGAMAMCGIVGAMTFPGGTDRFAFQTYVDQVLVPSLWEGACVFKDAGTRRWGDAGTGIGRGLKPRPIPSDQIKDLVEASNPWTFTAEGRFMSRVTRRTGTLRVPVSPCLRVFFGDG